LRALLEELDDRLRAFGAPVVDAFRPGLPPERVGEAHEDVLTWWAWHDGAAAGEVADDYAGPGIYFRPENTLVGPWHVISLDDASRIRRWLREAYPQLPETWLPVLQFEGSPVLCADTADGSLHIVDEGFVDQFRSLGEFVQLVLELFDSGLVGPHPEDERVPWFDAAALEGGLRRLSFW
jgi:hypothetical protein